MNALNTNNLTANTNRAAARGARLAGGLVFLYTVPEVRGLLASAQSMPVACDTAALELAISLAGKVRHHRPDLAILIEFSPDGPVINAYFREIALGLIDGVRSPVFQVTNTEIAKINPYNGGRYEWRCESVSENFDRMAPLNVTGNARQRA